MADQKRKNQEVILQQFNKLRQEQRMVAQKMSELKLEESEHKLVIDALKDVNEPTRKCYQLVGGVLMERTVGQVQPNLENNASKINTLITTMDKTLESKQKELVDFKEKHGIKVRGEDSMEDKNKSDSPAPTSTGVLVN
ncbi:prefoldin subunit 2-like [Bolinopsis microptera]|uniref:prefoldin subunit 2-like n=1 Tax=Bolinopsis microptera TaxID=2820187 RepID=UPI00307AAB4C